MINYYYEHLKQTKEKYIEDIKKQEKEVKKELDYLALLHELYENNEESLKKYLKENEK